jgi:hypothetical protein
LDVLAEFFPYSKFNNAVTANAKSPEAKSRYEAAGAFPRFSILGEASSRSGKEGCKSSTTTNLSGPIDVWISQKHGEVLVVANRPMVLHKLK